MDWKKEAIRDLQMHNGRKKACKAIKERCDALQLEMKSVGEPGEITKQLLDLHAKRKRLECAYQANEQLVSLVERGLAELTPAQRQVLAEFYVDRRPEYIDHLCTSLNVEQANLYKIKNAAIKEFTLKMYGILEY
ncbi:MAG: hypothetical protein E7572_09590 [Ruminococcaceae bacterium]|nr:hypothetical protein [Oscillospiraceae bacterium]